MEAAGDLLKILVLLNAPTVISVSGQRGVALKKCFTPINTKQSKAKLKSGCKSKS